MCSRDHNVYFVPDLAFSQQNNPQRHEGGKRPHYKVGLPRFPMQFCSVLEKSPFGAKSDFEIWAFKVFLFFGPEKSSKEGLEVATPENLKWKKYIRQSENANGSPLEPLWGSKKLKVSTKRTLRPTNLPFWFGEKSSWCRFEKKRKVHKVLHF